MIRPSDYPQLSWLCWNRDHDRLISDDVARSLYEHGWYLIEGKSLEAHERELIARLIRERPRIAVRQVSDCVRDIVQGKKSYRPQRKLLSASDYDQSRAAVDRGSLAGPPMGDELP